MGTRNLAPMVELALSGSDYRLTRGAHGFLMALVSAGSSVGAAGSQVFSHSRDLTIRCVVSLWAGLQIPW